jgi:SAM-dependent methyltransferase
MPYGQFVRTFLLPLLASLHFGLGLDRTLAGQRDGIEPETMYRWAGLRRRLTPPFLGLVTLPKWLGGRSHSEPSYKRQAAASPEMARFVLDGLLRNCERQLNKLTPSRRDSVWSGYLDHKSLYSAAQLSQKEKFVQEALDRARPRNVLDVGANEGRFSMLAASKRAAVVAIDSDPVVVGSVWKKASSENLDVLPLVVDLTRPTPAVGWRNEENTSFLERARGKFDMVLMLAVIHHMLVNERIPLPDLLGLADELSREYVLIEFVAPADPMFQRIVRGREELYAHMSPEWFEAAAASRFEVIRSTRIDGLNRWLYLFRRRRAAR